jgi:tripartite-type tricarboxylate transporter receptor subunit TctC
MFSPIAFGQEVWPTHVVTLIVPYPPGGLTDQLARKLQPKLSQELHVPVVVLNKPGANYLIALNEALHLDDHTLVFGDSFYNAGPKFTQPELAKKFDTLAVLAKSPMVIFTAKKMTSLEFKNLLSTNVKVDMANGSVGSPHYMWLTQMHTRADFVPIYYKGASQAMIDVLGGQVKFGITSLATSLPYVASGQLTPLVISSLKRNPELPTVPTFKELGLGGKSGDIWHGILVRRGLHTEYQKILVQALYNIYQSYDNADQIKISGLVYNLSTGAAAAKIVQDEFEHYKKIKRLSNAGDY